MPGGATFDIVAQGPDGDALEIEFDETDITVYGWSGSVVLLSTPQVEEPSENQLVA